MLACVRIGAIHSVVFGGFAAASLATRIDDAQAEGHGHRRRRHARRQGDPLQAPRRRGDPPREASAARTCIIVDRGIDAACRARAGRDLDYATLREQHLGAQVPCEWLESSEPSYILYTSGTTGKPKGVQRDTGGYAVALAASMRDIFCVRARRDDVHDLRHRLGRRPLVHRLRAAHQRLDDDHVRGPADPARPGDLVEDRRRARASRRCSPRRPRSAC